MATDLVEINVEEPQPEALERAAAALRRGRVIAIPTDALYMLVADPFNLRAVAGVFKAKGREPHRSLPILIRDTLMAEELASEAQTGADAVRVLWGRCWEGEGGPAFWPGHESWQRTGPNIRICTCIFLLTAFQ